MVADPRTGEDSQLRRNGANRRSAIGLGLLALILVIVLLALGGGGSGVPPPPSPQARTAPRGDQLAYRPGADAVLANRAAAGSAQVLFTKSPGGAFATAARVARLRPRINAAARGTDIPPALLEGLVFLESAGRADAIAGGDPANAAGLTQILPGTAQTLLAMHVNLPLSQALTRQIASAQAAGARRRMARLERARARADGRFSPALALAGAVRYLEIAQHGLGHRLDLAVAAYHAGIGNIQQVLNDYDGGRPVSYAQLYFDTAPDHHAPAWRLLASLGDDSALYLWRVLEAEAIMHLYRTQPDALHRLARLETAYPSNALVLVGRGATNSFPTPRALSAAYAAGALLPLPSDPQRLHLAYSPRIGDLAHRLRVPVRLYRGLRPAALSVLIDMAAVVHRLAGNGTPLTVSSAVLDARYQRRLGYADPPERTGYTFQIERRYSSGAQAVAFQFVLDRLQSLNLIAWMRRARTIEVTAAPNAARMLAHDG